MKLRGFLAIVATCSLVLGGSAVTAHATSTPQAGELQRYTPANKNFRAEVADGTRTLEVKVAHAYEIAVDKSGVHVDPKLRDQAQGVKLLNSDKVESIQSLFSLSKKTLQDLSAQARRNSNREQPNLNQWLQVTMKSGQDVQAFAAELNKNADIEIAYPIAEQPPAKEGTILAAENLEPKQGYLNSPEQSYGINAKYAHSQGYNGAGVTIADVEGGWELTHDDMTKLHKDAVLTEGTPKPEGVYHGTAVMGEIIADKNGFGVTGIAHGATPKVSHVVTTEKKFNPSSAIITAANALKAGDVLVVELQTPGCKDKGKESYVPQEWQAASYDAIVTATSKGIFVVEAAGNGAQNLDESCYGTSFPNGRANSGAIIVGAGAGMGADGSSSEICGTKGERQPFSTYGSRVDVFAWGECVVTTAEKNKYRDDFAGTSSATPIVSGAVAVLAGAAKSKGKTLTPKQMRDLVASTGTAAKANQMIGTQPDLKKALEKLGASGNTTSPSTKPVTSAPTTQVPSKDELIRGQAKSFDLSQGKQQRFYVELPKGAKDLSIKLSGTNGDADLYVRFNSAPDNDHYDCRPWLSDSNETCNFAQPATGRYHVMVDAAEATNNLSLIANWKN